MNRHFYKCFFKRIQTNKRKAFAYFVTAKNTWGNKHNGFWILPSCSPFLKMKRDEN